MARHALGHSAPRPSRHPRWAHARTLAALSLLGAACWSSVASAADQKESPGLLGAAPQLTLAQVSDPAEDGDANANAPSGAGGNTVGGQGGVTLTVGGSAPQAGTSGTPAPAPDQPAEEPKKKPGMTFFDRIGGSAIFFQQNATLNTFFKGYQRDWNPTVATQAFITPRFAINRNWQLRARLVTAFEWTNSDFTTRRNEVTLSDTNLQLFYRGIPAIAGKVKLMPFAGLMFPTSKDSRARTMVVTPTIGTQVVYPIEHFLGGDALVIGMFTYGRPFYRYTSPGRTDDAPYSMSCFGASTDCSNQLSGMMNARDTFTTALIFVAEWGKFAPGAFMMLNNQIAYLPKQAPGTMSTLPNGQEPNRFRTSTFFNVWFDWYAADWITPEIGYQQFRNAMALDGKYGNPFFSNKQNQIVYIAANLQLDSLLKKITGQKAQAGVVRSKNKSTPQPIRFY